MAKQKIDMEDDREYMNLPIPVACSGCVRLRNVMTKTCEAFPSGIPDIIWKEGNKHLKPIEGDGGLRFKLMTDEELDAELEKAKTYL